MFELIDFRAQFADFAAGGLALGVAQQPALAGFQKFLAPAVVKIGGDALAPAQLADAALPAQPLQHDADLIVGGVLLARHTPDRTDGSFSGVFLLSHSASSGQALWLESVPKLTGLPHLSC